MTATTAADTLAAIATMPRGGPDASCLDRALQTDVPEYTDRYDIPDEVKQKVVSALERLGERSGGHGEMARAALELVTDVADPRILELGSGHGKLSTAILDAHSTATVTTSDLDPTSVANIAAGSLGTNTRADTRVIDATAIDAADDSYDLVVFAQSFHHLPPEAAARAIAEGTRVGKQFLVIDLERGPLPLMIAMAPVAGLVALLRPGMRPLVHDGFISALRSYSRSAFSALGKAAHPDMNVRFLPKIGMRGPHLVAIAYSKT